MKSQPARIPVICDRCRAEGEAGTDPFEDFGDLLDFAPVPRRTRVGGWTPDVQRAFVAALAVTGSPRRAATAVGRAQYGYEQLKKAKGNESFLAACERALALAEEKARQRLADGVGAVARVDAQATAGRAALPALAANAPEELRPVTEEDRELLRAESMHRAIHGTEVPIFHGGVQVGTRRVFNDRLAIYHLREAEGGAGAPQPRLPPGAIVNPDEIRLFNTLRNNPGWTMLFAKTVLKSPNSLVRATMRPWQFDKIGVLIEALFLLRDAFRRDLARTPEKLAAYETLLGPEYDPETFGEAQAALVACLEIVFPNALLNLEIMHRLRLRRLPLSQEDIDRGYQRTEDDG